MKFNEKIKKIRLDNNLTQEEMANKLYVSRSSIAKWEQDRGLPSVDLLYKISEKFDIKIDDLLNEEDIKFITIENKKKIDKLNKEKFLYISLIMFLILSLLAFTVYYFNNINRSISSPNQQKEENFKKVNSRIIEIDEQNNLIEVNLFQNNANIKYNYHDFLKIPTYNINGDLIEKPVYKKDYCLELSFDNKLKVINNKDIIKQIIIIETNIDDNYIYGFFLSTNKVDIIPTKSPISDFDTSYQYNNNTSFGASFIFPWCTYSGIGLNKDFVMKREYLKSTFYNNFIYKQIIHYSIDIDDSLEVYLYALDNSKDGFYLHSIIKPSCNKLMLNGVYIDKNLKQDSIDNKYNNKYSIDLEFDININFTPANNSINIYEYDKNHSLIRETNFTTYEDFFILNEDYFKVNKDTLYYIIEENNRLGKVTKICNRGSFNKVSLPLKYGYIQSFIIGG